MRFRGLHRSLRIAAAALLCAALADSEDARAQAPAEESVALLPAGVQHGVNRRLASHALRAMQDFLLDRGYVLIDARKLNRLPTALRECRQQGCMAAVHRALRADHVVAVELQRSDAGTAVRAQWNDASFIMYAGEATLGADTTDDAENAGQEALRTALEKHRRGPGPWLSIAGTPMNAVVEIDGKAVGGVPFLGRVEPGLARVVVRKEGYEPHTEQVNVAGAPDEYQRLRVALKPKRAIDAAELRPLTREQFAAKAPEPKPIVAMPAADDRMRNFDDDEEDDAGPSFHPADIVIGGALVIGGAALAIGPARTWARDGKCWDPPECSEHVEFGRAQQAQLVGGAALAVVGVLWTFVFKPIGHAAAPEREAARDPGSL